MAAPTKQAMRLLSPRLQCLKHQQTSACTRQIRCVSGRYSNPTKRTVSTAPTGISSFIGSASAESQPVHNPMDIRANRLEHEEKRQYHTRRMRFAGMGLLLSMGGMVMILFNLDLDGIDQAEKKRRGQQLDASSEANARFQGKEVHVIGAGEDKRIVAQGNGENIELVETGTSSVPHFPRTIFLPSSPDSSTAASATGLIGIAPPNTPQNPGNAANQEEYTLVGLGIRTVMWIEVYVVGMYVRTVDITTLQAKLIHSVNQSASTLIPAEKEELRKRLLDPEQSREIWSDILKVPGIKTAWRMSPTRNTDFGHLRDGFVNGINARKAEARTLTSGGETEYDSEDFGQAMQSLKAIFTGGKAPKQSILILARDNVGVLDVLFQPKPSESGKQKEMELLGSVSDERIARLIWLGYLAGAKVSSPPAREGVVAGCVGFAARPVGSVETRVI
ncbi:hypothetical protein LTR36_009569 [Oleoguttula mirabilis]|uniref:Chalcone isomerase domain-containing protein n=1 Tax=Oleoguttula mirabilis TaxID=1507867 RepID=A0AAV9JT53_9PEZI|nr:hypothetical protein LTR36_009569 [Oleoguttula mirabilis]